MAFDINNFRTNGLPLGGARPSLFQVELTSPPAIGLSTDAMRKFTFNCFAAPLPSAQSSSIKVPYFGRNIKVADNTREYPDWEVAVLNDEDFQVKAAFEAWNSKLNTIISNVRDARLTVENDYKADMRIIQYGKNGQVLRAYIMVGAFPVQVGGIDLNWGTTNEIENFRVTFAHDWWVPDTVGVKTDQVAE